ncbi:hypothetical protein [Pectobacterium parmentieri]|uniref:hypothetical protein n=1 Tax=Pectobacterium parmentieri TaxID=1905730 RepID=UPI00067C8B4D|nr:hypothetical protein [Pectobacterium parmentieri]AOR58928.1 hypothetical protein A8F97_08405 [Pectobacterium parmentieri]QQA74234.1 hypothetical protein JBL47_12365 [Pectobacterium parmentieri]
MRYSENAFFVLAYFNLVKRRGCMGVFAALERSGKDSVVVQIGRVDVTRLEQVLCHLFAVGQRNGDVSSARPALLLARAFLSSYYGLRVLVRRCQYAKFAEWIAVDAAWLTHDIDGLVFIVDGDRIAVEGREWGVTRDRRAWPDVCSSQGRFENVFEFDLGSARRSTDTEGDRRAVYAGSRVGYLG